MEVEHPKPKVVKISVEPLTTSFDISEQKESILGKIKIKHVREFIDGIWDEAERVQEIYGVPMQVCIAQAIQESGYGRSKYAVNNNNFFGIRYNKKYAKFESISKCFSAYGKVMTQDCYDGAYGVEGYLEALVQCGYAGDKDYTKTLRKIIKKYLQ